jgi:hypothetical protein
VAGAERSVQWTLTLAAEHQPVDVVGTEVVFRQAEPEVQRVRVPIADARLRLAVHVHFERLIEPGDILAEDILVPADHLHPALVRARQHVGDHVVLRVIGGFLRGDAGIPVVLRMRRREVAAVVVVVVFLLTVIG